MAAQYKQISLSDFEDFINQYDGVSDMTADTHAKEHVYSIDVNQYAPRESDFLPGVIVKVYSSIHVSSEAGRKAGADAIRVFVIDTVADKCIIGGGQLKRVHRVENWANNLSDRLDFALEKVFKWFRVAPNGDVLHWRDFNALLDDGAFTRDECREAVARLKGEATGTIVAPANAGGRRNGKKASERIQAKTEQAPVVEKRTAIAEAVDAGQARHPYTIEDIDKQIAEHRNAVEALKKIRRELKRRERANA